MSTPAQTPSAPALAAQRHLFISYTQRDRAWAEWIAEELQADGYVVRYQARDFRRSGSFVGEMKDGLQNAASVIAVVSSDYLASSFCESEWRTGFVLDPTGTLGRLVLVRVGACQVDAMLQPMTRIELAGLRRVEEARALLLKGVHDAPATAEARPGAGALALPAAPRRRTPFPGAAVQRAIVRVARFVLVAWLVYGPVRSSLGAVLPSLQDSRPGDLQMTSGVMGLIAAFLVDLLWTWWRERRT